MKHIKWLIVFCFMTFIGTLLIYAQLPEQVPMHWNIHGEVDRYGSKLSLLFLSFMPLGIYFLMHYVPRFDPKFENYKKHERAYNMVRIATVLFLTCIHFIAVLAALGIISSITRWILLLIGLLFVVLGNYMTQARSNYTFGIKIPWTLSDERVWKKTHRFGGFAYVVIGLSAVVSSLVRPEWAAAIFFTVLVISHVLIMLYSYAQYRKMNRDDS